MKYLYTLIFVLVFCFAPGYGKSLANDGLSGVRGSDSAEFQSTLALWLNGADEAALRRFGQLARNDNRAAQIFLAQIEARDWLHRSVTKDLTRKGRIELLRNPKGLSGQSWLQAAMADTPIAMRLWAAKQPYRSIEPALGLINADELGDAIGQIDRAFDQGVPLDALKLASSGKLAPYTLGYSRPLIELWNRHGWPGYADLKNPEWKSVIADISELPLPSAGDRLIWGYAPFNIGYEHLLKRKVDPKQVGEALFRVKVLAPITAIVRRRCGVGGRQAMAALHVYFRSGKLLTPLFSPSGSLLSQNTYRTSERFGRDVLSFLQSPSPYSRVLLRIDRCAYQLVHAVN